MEEKRKEKEKEEEEAAGAEKEMKQPRKRKRKEVFPFGNYRNYYGYRVILFVRCSFSFPKAVETLTAPFACPELKKNAF